MKLQNGYKVVYEKIADGTRTFYATENNTCDPTKDLIIIEAEIGQYKLIYEKDGRFYGSETGIPAVSDTCLCGENFDKVFKVAEQAATASVEEEEVPATNEQEVEPEAEPEEDDEVEPETAPEEDE